VRHLSRGLAEIKEHHDQQVVRFIHQSVNDYLIQDGLQRLEVSLMSSDIAVGRWLSKGDPSLRSLSASWNRILAQSIDSCLVAFSSS
jgi:hypothetical protein